MANTYLGPFGSMKFEEYSYKEYPKHVVLKDGTSRVVNSQVDEVRLIAELADKIPEQHELLAEKEELARQVADLQAKLATMQGVPQAAPVEAPINVDDLVSPKKK